MSPLLSDLSGGSPASLPVSPPGPSLWCWVSSEAEGCPRRPAVVSVVEHVCVREAREIRPGIVPGCSLKSIRISWPCDICIHRNLTALLPQHPSRQRDQLFNLYTYTHTRTHTPTSLPLRAHLQLCFHHCLSYQCLPSLTSPNKFCLWPSHPSPPPAPYRICTLEAVPTQARSSCIRFSPKAWLGNLCQGTVAALRPWTYHCPSLGHGIFTQDEIPRFHT